MTILFCTILLFYVNIFTSIPVYCSFVLVVLVRSRDRPENPETSHDQWRLWSIPPAAKNKFPTRKSARVSIITTTAAHLIVQRCTAILYPSYSRPSCRPRLFSIFAVNTCYPSATSRSRETHIEPSPRNNQTRSLLYTMSFPGMTPPMGGLGGGAGAGNMQGMNEQEQMMVKSVSLVCRDTGMLCWSMVYGLFVVLDANLCVRCKPRWNLVLLRPLCRVVWVLL